MLLVTCGLTVSRCYRARQHAPLGHQLSHSGKGSIGQPARIEAFWPVKGDPYTLPLVPLQAATPRAASRGKKRVPRKRAFVSSSRQAQEGSPNRPRAAPGQEQSEMADLQELGRPLEPSLGAAGEISEKKSPAGAQLTRHLEYDILQCIAKNRPEVSAPPHPPTHQKILSDGCPLHKLISIYACKGVFIMLLLLLLLLQQYSTAACYDDHQMCYWKLLLAILRLQYTCSLFSQKCPYTAIYHQCVRCADCVACCMQHLSWLVVKAREMGVRSSNPAVAAANTICKLTRRQAVSKAPPLLTE